MVHSEDYASCVCKDGFFNVDMTCVPCDPGYRWVHDFHLYDQLPVWYHLIMHAGVWGVRVNHVTSIIIKIWHKQRAARHAPQQGTPMVELSLIVVTASCLHGVIQ